MGLPRASDFLVITLGVMAVTRSGEVFCFLIGVASSTRSGNGPSNLNTIVRGVEVDPVFCELPREMTEGTCKCASLVSALVLLLLKYELVLVLIKSDGQ